MMERIPRSPLQVLFKESGADVFFDFDPNLNSDLPMKPTMVPDCRVFKVIPTSAIDTVNEMIADILGDHGFDLRTLPGKRIQMMTTPEIPNKGWHFKPERVANVDVRIRGLKLDTKMGIDGIFFVSERFTELVARAHAPTEADIPAVTRALMKRGFKITAIGLKGIAVPILHGRIGFQRLMLYLGDEVLADQILTELETGTDIVADADTAKLIRKRRFVLELGRTIMLHEVGAIFAGGISLSQALPRWFLLPRKLGWNVNPAPEFVERIHKQITEAINGFSDPEVAANILVRNEGPINETSSVLRLTADILRQFGFVKEAGFLQRVLLDHLKIALRKLRLGPGFYLGFQNTHPGIAVIPPVIARMLGLNNGDLLLIQKSPILPGDTLILPVIIDHRAHAILVHPTDMPAGWDADGDKVALAPASEVFADPLMAKEFFDNIRSRIKEITFGKWTMNPETEVDNIELGKEMIARADAGFTRMLLSDTEINVDLIAKAGALLQAAVNLANGKEPQMRHEVEAGLHMLASTTARLDTVTQMIANRTAKADPAAITPTGPLAEFIPEVEFTEPEVGSLKDLVPDGAVDPEVKALFLKWDRIRRRLFGRMLSRIRKIENEVNTLAEKVVAIDTVVNRSRRLFANARPETKIRFLVSGIRNEILRQRMEKWLALRIDSLSDALATLRNRRRELDRCRRFLTSRVSELRVLLTRNFRRLNRRFRKLLARFEPQAVLVTWKTLSVAETDFLAIVAGTESDLESHVRFLVELHTGRKRNWELARILGIRTPVGLHPLATADREFWLNFWKLD